MIVRIVPSSIALPIFLKGTLGTLVNGPSKIAEAKRLATVAEKRLLNAQAALAKAEQAWAQACTEGGVSTHQGLKTMTKKHTCPHCGNRNPETIEDNGAGTRDDDYTLLCVARVSIGEDAFDGQANPPLTVGSDGKVDCGMQWSPNEQRNVG
jgi:hypothetical protein